jgi:uncharacterized protein YecE (DUF72 family)
VSLLPASGDGHCELQGAREACIDVIRIGIGGWTFAPWRGTFYPPGLAHGHELGYASRRLTSIEINGTFYRTQKPESFRRWAAEVPEDFVFAVKGPRYATTRPSLADAGPAVERFLASGVLELGDKLGPILWQLPPAKHFDSSELEAFLALLPRTASGRPLRHALEVRHRSFCVPSLVELLCRFATPLVFADADAYPSIADVAGDFVYARLQRASAAEPTGYSAAALDLWADRLRTWASGGEPEGLPRLAPPQTVPPGLRDCFVYFIDGAKERAPAAAVALIERLALTSALHAPISPRARGPG